MCHTRWSRSACVMEFMVRKEFTVRKEFRVGKEFMPMVGKEFAVQ